MIRSAVNGHVVTYSLVPTSGLYARGVLGGTKTPPNSQKYTKNKKVHTVCICKIQGSFITL